MKGVKFFLVILIIFVAALFIFIYFNRAEISFEKKSSFEILNERTFYKKSDRGTDVLQLTTHPGNDGIFYQEPSYFSFDSQYFMFKSERNGKNKLMIMDLASGNFTDLATGHYGWAPTWSRTKNEVYVGRMGNILVINVENKHERTIALAPVSLASFLHLNPSGDRLVFVEENIGDHVALSTIKTDGTEYAELFILDKEKEFYLDHPTFINDREILFLTRGKERDFSGDYNKPYVLNLDGSIQKLAVDCSHYDVNPRKNIILCATEGYIIDTKGNMLKELPLHGHGAWHPDGERFLMTGDPVPIPDGPYFGKIVIMNVSNDEILSVVSHENTYNSSIAVHIQPNAQFSQDGNYIIYESDLLRGNNTDLYLVRL